MRKMITAVCLVLMCGSGCHKGTTSSASLPDTVIAKPQANPHSSFVGEWLWTEPLSLQMQTSYSYYDIKATGYARITLNPDRTGKVAVRIVNETEQDFKKLCDECVSAGDVSTLAKLKPYFDSYTEYKAKWSQETDADGNYIIIVGESGNIVRYRWSLNDDGSMMTLTPSDGNLPHVYTRLH